MNTHTPSASPGSSSRIPEPVQVLVPFPFTALEDPLTQRAMLDVMSPLVAFCAGVCYASQLALRLPECDVDQVADAVESVAVQLQAAGRIFKAYAATRQIPPVPREEGQL